MYVERQRKWIKEVGLEVGDRVLIVSSATNDQGGWDDCWVSDMDATVGMVGTVENGEKPQDGEHRGVSVNVDGYVFNYPFFVLVKV